MKILYGVVGEGMGHATRSRVSLLHLLQQGHQIKVVVSGRAHQFLVDRFKGIPGISFEEIRGLHLIYEDTKLEVGASLLSKLEQAPDGLAKNLKVFAKVTKDFSAQCVISDFESWAYWFGLVKQLPVISIDNMQILNRCSHDDFVTADRNADFLLAKLAVKSKLPGAYHYLIASFFYPPVRKPRTTLIPPILRPEILKVKREPKSHVLVYQTSSSNQQLLSVLKKLPYEFRVYGMGKNEKDGNVTCCPFNEKTFVEDLRTARAVVAGGGFSLMCEAVHLHVPILSMPIEGQYEQELNARYLQKLGYGKYTPKLDEAIIEDFLQGTDEMAQNLSRYVPRNNSMLFECIDELLRKVVEGKDSPERLDSRAIGKWKEDEGQLQ
jgi:uncharacterized protein (TIGR00661 family)